MSAEPTRRAPRTSLREIVERYASLAGSFGDAVALSEFALGLEETQNLFSALDEDYHISRFFHFHHEHGNEYSINGEKATHVVIDPDIRLVL